MKEEVLIVRKQKKKDNLKIKVCMKHTSGWSASSYERIIKTRDYNLLSFLFYDLMTMGYPIDKAFAKYKEMKEEPELFFLR